MRTTAFVALLFAFVAGSTVHAPAQTIGFAEAIDRLAAACGADIKKHCQGVPLGSGGVRNCLVRNQAKNAPRCNATMAEVFRLVQEHKVTHIHVVPALLIRWISDPTIGDYDLSSMRMIQSGGVYLNNERIAPDTMLTEASLCSDTMAVIRKGKKNYHLLKFV